MIKHIKKPCRVVNCKSDQTNFTLPTVHSLFLSVGSNVT